MALQAPPRPQSLHVIDLNEPDPPEYPDLAAGIPQVQIPAALDAPRRFAMPQNIPLMPVWNRGRGHGRSTAQPVQVSSATTAQNDQ